MCLCVCVCVYDIVYVNLLLSFSVQISADLRISQESLCWLCGLFVVREGEQRLRCSFHLVPYFEELFTMCCCEQL